MNLEHKISKKIKEPHEIKKILNKNKDKKSIMCHGNFDLVHPGHIRHLMYAKSKADIIFFLFNDIIDFKSAPSA